MIESYPVCIVLYCLLNVIHSFILFSLFIIIIILGWFCIAIISVGVAAELIALFGIWRVPCTGLPEEDCAPLSNILVLIVGGIPIAMPTVLSVTMALGAGQLAKHQAIVSRLTAVEEIAGMDILCSDKTGTLTKNKLSVAEPITYEGEKGDDVLFQAALASKPDNDDAIDIAMVEHLKGTIRFSLSILL